MNEKVKSIIVKYKELIDNNNFAPVYGNLVIDSAPEIIGEFTQTMLSVGIDPIVDGNLKYMPSYYVSCLPVKTFEIPTTIIRLDEGCFAYCEELEHITIPENIQRIGRYAFAECGLKELHIPKTVETIDMNAFFQTNITILCEKDSAADHYCEFYGIPVRYV